MTYFKILIAVLLLSLGSSYTATAQEEAPEPKIETPSEKVRHAPQGCDFEITFPEKPYKSRRCPEGLNGKCYALTGYTMVYEMTSTVEVSVTCVPSPPENYSRYNEAVIRAALGGMLERANINDFNITYQEKDNVRQGSLIGSGTYGRQGRIYNSQLWVGPNSIFTMEAKLIGPQNEAADTAFRDILQSIKIIEEKPQEPVEAD